MTVFTFALLMIVAAITGSAIGILLPKAYRDEPLAGNPYVCPECRDPASLNDAFAALGGVTTRHCRNCHAALSRRPQLLAAATIGLFAICYWRFGDFWPAVLAGFFCAIFVALTFTDLERRLLPDRIVLPGILLAVGTAWLLPDMSLAGSLLGGLAAVGAAAVLLVASLPFGRQALGMGDVKVIVLMGVLLGPASFVVALAIASISASVAAILLLLLRFRRFGDYIPHGPFLVLGAVVGLLWGLALWHWYIR